MALSFNPKSGFNAPTISYSDKVSKGVQHVGAEVTVPAEVEAQPYAKRLAMSAQIDLLPVS